MCEIFLKPKNANAVIQGTNCNNFARFAVINAGYLNEVYTEKNLLNVKNNRFPTLINKAKWMILQKMSNFFPVEMHTTAAIVARHATVSAKAKLKTNLFDGTSSDSVS